MSTLLSNLSSLVTCSETGVEIQEAAIIWEGAQIQWIGKADSIPTHLKIDTKIDGRGLLAVPGLIDCHTHLAFGGSRKNDFVLRILGKSYVEMEEAGGGINSTVAATRALSREELIVHCNGYVDAAAKQGITTLEAKSGYGLSLQTELKILECYREVAKTSPITVVPTFLGAHTYPKEMRSDHERYLSIVIEEMLPSVAEQKLARFCDVFIEKSAFSLEEGRRVLEAAKRLGLGLKLHIDQFTSMGGIDLACELGAVSVDHMEATSHEDALKLASHGVTPVLLPTASLYTHAHPANGRMFVDAGCNPALATDFNPGSAPNNCFNFAMVLGCTLNRLTPTECLHAVTINAARALGMEEEIGSLEVGKKADIALIDAVDVDEWMYLYRENRCKVTIKNGLVVG